MIAKWQTTHASINGTSLQGYIATTAGTLTRVFGKPGDGDGHKVWNEWTILFTQNGFDYVATIYDWKQHNPLPINQTYAWHIGGHTDAVIALVRDALAEAGVPNPEARKMLLYEPFTGAVA